MVNQGTVVGLLTQRNSLTSGPALSHQQPETSDGDEMLQGDNSVDFKNLMIERSDFTNLMMERGQNEEVCENSFTSERMANIASSSLLPTSHPVGMLHISRNCSMCLTDGSL